MSFISDDIPDEIFDAAATAVENSVQQQASPGMNEVGETARTSPTTVSTINHQASPAINEVGDTARTSPTTVSAINDQLTSISYVFILFCTILLIIYLISFVIYS